MSHPTATIRPSLQEVAMAQNTVQYQRGLSLPEFFDEYGLQERCEDLVRAWRWPEGFICPRCQGCWHSEFRRLQTLAQPAPSVTPSQSGPRHRASASGTRGPKAIAKRLRARTSVGSPNRHGGSHRGLCHHGPRRRARRSSLKRQRSQAEQFLREQTNGLDSKEDPQSAGSR